jgi:hypothetical protein
MYTTPITFTATVTAVDPGAGVPTGTVDFFADGVLFASSGLDSNGVATSVPSVLNAGNRTITAHYYGS